MPRVLFEKGYEFFFYSNEGTEPMHIHVGKAGSVGKIWFEPRLKIQYLYGFSPVERKEILEIADLNLEFLKSSWNEYFNK